ncbi:hypothetical protein TI06_24055, partial [Vibrio vulnificus]
SQTPADLASLGSDQVLHRITEPIEGQRPDLSAPQALVQGLVGLAGIAQPLHEQRADEGNDQQHHDHLEQ